MRAKTDLLRTLKKYRLRFLLNLVPTNYQKQILERSQQVTFLPMEAIGEKGELDLSLVRDKEVVSTGYTLFFEGDVVVAKITPCFENGKGAIIKGTLTGVGFGTTELYVLSPKPELDASLLYYLTASPQFRLLGEAHMTGAAGQKRVPEDFIKNYPTPLLSLLEQRTIANFLDRETARLDKLIAAKERLLILLAEKRHALITQAVTRGLKADALMWDSGIEWLGKVPRQWKVERLKFHLRKIEQGWSPQCDNIPAEDDEWGVLKVGAVNGWVFDPNENKRLPKEIEPLVEYEIKQGDILMSRANTRELLGSIATVRSKGRKLLLCDKLYRLVLNSSRLFSDYLVCFFRSAAGRYEFERDATGASSSMQNIGQDSVVNVWITVPPFAEQQEIVNYIETETKKLDLLKAVTERTISLLKERRASLIAAAVTGQIAVGE